MNYRTNDRCIVPPVKGVLTGKQARCECADQWGSKKNYFVSDEVDDIYHMQIPSEDGFKNINTEAVELLDGLWKINKRMFIRTLARVAGREALDLLKEEIGE